MSAEQQCQPHILFLACTRPAMKWGVPFEGFYANAFGTLFGGMFLGSPVYWVLAVPVHLVLRGISNKNPNFFREWKVWLDTRAAIAGGVLWANKADVVVSFEPGTTLLGAGERA